MREPGRRFFRCEGRGDVVYWEGKQAAEGETGRGPPVDPERKSSVKIRSCRGEKTSVYTYCLFCETEKCAAVAGDVARRFSCRAISPRQVQHTWDRGRMVDREHDLLPGYVFVYLAQGLADIRALQAVPGVIRCLSTTDRQFELTGGDERFALLLLEKGGVIGKTRVYQEGQRIRICDGAYQGMETKILRVNRRNQRMQIEIPFASQAVRTWVEYELVRPAGEEGALR